MTTVCFWQASCHARWHAVAEEGIPIRDIVEVLAAGVGLPVRSVSPDEAQDTLGWMAAFAQIDMPASSAWTRERLGWEPTGPGLLEDLRRTDYIAGS